MIRNALLILIWLTVGIVVVMTTALLVWKP